MSGAHAAAFGSDAARAIQIRVMAWGSTRGDAPLVVAALETTQDTEQRAALFGARPQRTQRSAHARRQPGEPGSTARGRHHSGQLGRRHVRTDNADLRDLRVRAASIASHDVSGATLAKLSGPTAEDPYQNLSVMWMVGEQGWPLSMIVRPRDFIILSASGIIT
ncbi:hypothetical protein GQ600_7199 [Phytophthora cactorum]|nr:hypothetical protein GQ600_7199 [Phytophthora cactorum]